MYKLLYFTSLFFIFSCNQNKTFDKVEIISNKNDQFQYKVFQHTSKINGQSIDQCENYYEFSSDSTSYQMYGADISDVFSEFRSIPKYQIKLQNNDPIFYSIEYSGMKSKEVNLAIFDRLLQMRNLKIDSSFQVKKHYVLSVDSIEQLIPYQNHSTNEVIRIEANDSKMVFKNVTLEIVCKELEKKYGMLFTLQNSLQKSFNLELPNDLPVDKLLVFLKETYGIQSTSGEKSVCMYSIKN